MLRLELMNVSIFPFAALILLAALATLSLIYWYGRLDVAWSIGEKEDVSAFGNVIAQESGVHCGDS